MSKPQPIISSTLASAGTNETHYLPLGGGGYQVVRKCGPAENRSEFIQPPAKYNVGGLALSNPQHPPFTDPLYAPYLLKDSSNKWGCNISPYKRNPSYPVVDPGRLRLGWGVQFRSQYEGLCPIGYVMGANNVCHQMDEPIGYFYSDQVRWRYPGSGLICKNNGADEMQTKDPRAW